MDGTLTRDTIESFDHGPSQPGEDPLLDWVASVEVLEDLDIWRSVSKMLFVAALALGVLFGALVKSFEALLAGSVAAFALLMVMYFMLAVAIDLTGGSPEHFSLTPRGIRCGTSPDIVRIPYGEVTRLDIAPLRRYVRVDGGPLNRPIGLYCTEENFAPVLATLRERCRGAKFVDHGAEVR